MKLDYTFSDQDDITTIHEKSIEILATVGMSFQSKDALEIFQRNGAKIDGEVVYFSRKMIEDALNKLPNQFQWCSRNGSITIGDGVSKYISTHGPINVLKQGTFHKPLAIDHANFHKLNQTSSVIDADDPYLIGEIFTPEGKLMDRSYLNEYRMASTLMYTTKPVMGFTEGTHLSEMSIHMIQQFYDIWDKIVAVGLINVASPLRLSRDSCEGLISYAQNAQAIIINPGLSPGISAPPSLAGVL